MIIIALIGWIDFENDYNSSLSLKLSSNLELLVNQFNNATPEKSNDPEKVCSSKCYDIEEMHNIEIPHKNKSLCLFHFFFKWYSLNARLNSHYET